MLFCSYVWIYSGQYRTVFFIKSLDNNFLVILFFALFFMVCYVTDGCIHFLVIGCRLISDVKGLYSGRYVTRSRGPITSTSVHRSVKHLGSLILWRRSWQQRNIARIYTEQFSGIWPAKKPRWSSLLVGQGSRSLGIFQGQLIPIRSKRYSLQGYRVWNKESSRKSCLFLIG